MTGLLDSTGAPGSRVALLLARGPRVSVAMLACLRAGRPFVPLGEEEPPARLRLMLEVAGPAALVTDRPPGELPEALRDLPRIDVWGAGEAVATAPHDPAAEAYLLFTSGSTGAPKGVAVSHGALVNRLCWGQDALALTGADVVLQKTPCTFDVALPELLGPLLAGARVVSLDEGAHRDPGAVADAIVNERVTVCHFVPSMLREFVRWPGARACTSLRHVLCSGEALTSDLVRDLWQVLPHVRVHNLYGPTESTVEVSHWEAPRSLGADAPVLIGAPVANTTLSVVDEELRPVPAGETGELCIGGAQLAIGYAGEEALTRAAFVTPPDGERVYRSGDLVRMVEGGIEFLGRADDQVKVRGVRVEPAEVEAALARHPAVAEAAVVPRSRASGADLVAFVVPRAPEPPAALAAELRDAVRRSLPAAFVPAAVHALPALPRTSSGKLDRRALRERAEAAEPAGPAPPAGDELAAAWHAALEAGPADPAAGFLDLGGHSLAAARLAGRLLAGRGVRIPLAWLVRDNLSLDGLRARLETAAPAAAAAEPGPVSAAQRRLWVLERINGSLAAYNVVSALSLAVPVDPGRLRAALAAVVARHAALRTRFVQDASGGPAQEAAASVPLPLAVRDVAGLDLAAELREAQWRPLPSDRAPLFSLELLRAPEASGLVLAASHLIADQQSVDVFWRDLFAAYGGRELGPAPAPSPRRGAPDPADLAWWTEALAGAPAALRMPFQRRRPDRQTFAGTTVSRHLDAAAAARLEARARALHVAPTALLLAAFGAVLGRWSGDDEVVVGVPTDGRADLAEAGAIGFYVDTLAIRVPAGDGQAAACQERLRAATAHSDVPFEDVLRALDVRRSAGRNPLFQAWFNDQSVHDAAHVLDGVPAAVARHPEPPSLFDVGLYVFPAEGGGLVLDLTTARDVFDDGVAAHLADQVLRQLDEAPAATGLPAPMPSPHAAETPASLAARFREVAVREPTRIAIRHGDEGVTYGALAERAAGLAAGLAGLAGAGEVVGLVAGRTPDVAAAILAALESGVPFALLDARLPERYLRETLEAANARAAVWLDAAPVPAGAGWTAPGALPAGAPRRRRGGRTSHLLATSGSAGAPKLVAVAGRAFAPALLDHAAALGLGPDDRFAVLSGAAHDPVFRDLLLPLVLGATTAMPREQGSPDPSRLWRWLVLERPTVLHLTPARASLLVAGARGGQLAGVRAVVVGGDAFPRALVPALRGIFPAAAICNAYGTTEIPQVASLHRCQDGEEALKTDGSRVYVPVGTGAGARRLVVAVGARPAEVGELGDICVLDGLPAGRVNSGPLPARTVAGRRLLLTGDRGRVGLDGEVDWCGRGDRQLSVAGHRVEPDQVELALLEDRELVEAVVAPLDPAGPASGLVGYVVPSPALAARADPAREAHLGALLGRLRASLPPWCVPAALHLVPRIVTDRNGKPDVAATAELARPAPERAVPDGVEAVLDRSVRRLLPAGAALLPDTNFFEAGFDSLTLLLLHADLRTAGYADLDPTDLFRWPNLRALSVALSARRPAAPASRRRDGEAPAEHLRQMRRRLREALLPRGAKEDLPWSNKS